VHQSAIKKTAITSVAITIIALPLFYPNPKGPTGIQWLVAMFEGRGTPHYPVGGSFQSNLEAFFARNPELRPKWHSIPDEENGLLQALELIQNGGILTPTVLDPLRELSSSQPWDHDGAATFLKRHQDFLDAIRRIGRLEHRSASVLPMTDLLIGNHQLARGFKTMSDLLVQSMILRLQHHNHSGALEDFQTIYALAAHLDQHEAVCMYHATISVIMRLAAQDVLRKALPALPPGSDLSGYLRTLGDQPGQEQVLANLFRGEAVWGMAIWFSDAASSDENNPIWNIEPFTGLPFHFDPAARHLTPDPASSLHSEPDHTRIIQLPQPPAQLPPQSTDY